MHTCSLEAGREAGHSNGDVLALHPNIWLRQSRDHHPLDPIEERMRTDPLGQRFDVSFL
ncbi:hypothetical protein MYX65_08025 [Acidobacteria bacterium AH-259-L09]|nr:hypothetical protein [Acidobacteria bacterium AH-259-L09]